MNITASKPAQFLNRFAKALTNRLAAVTLLASFAVSACGEPAIEIEDSNPSPALWSVTNSDGELEGWLFGTIHSLPDGVTWRTPALDKAITQSDWLALEIEELSDPTELAAIFSELATSPAQPLLSERLAAAQRPQLARLLKQTGFKDSDFRTSDTWAAALTLAQAATPGEPENGVDLALLKNIKTRKVLEGARGQLSIFDGLAEQDQRDLLSAVVSENAQDSEAAYRALVEMWLSGDMDKLAAENSEGILADPELRAALLTNRNEQWAGKIGGWMTETGPLLIAVGAAHMAGDEGLPVLLAQKGYVVRRIQ